MINSRLLFNNSYPESLRYLKVYGFKSSGDITNKNLLTVLRTSDIVELNTVYRVITLIYIVSHRGNLS